VTRRRFPSSRLIRLIRQAFPLPRRKAPERNRLFCRYLGFSSENPVPPGADCRVTLSADRDFYPSCLFVPSNIALDFVLVGIDVNGEDFQEDGPISCSAFSEIALQEEWQCCFPAGSVVTLWVRNVSHTAQHFIGTFREKRSRSASDDSVLRALGLDRSDAGGPQQLPPTLLGAIMAAERLRCDP
jgi:hypothetical protein